MGCASSTVTNSVDNNSDTEEVRCKFDDDYALGKVLGKGAFGVVYATSERGSGWRGAVKVLETTYFDEKKQKDEVDSDRVRIAKNEVKTWTAVSGHPNVVELRNTFNGLGCCLMIMERCDCTVTEKLRSGLPNIKEQLPRMLRDMLLGINACHQAKVVHRDIKTENFMLGADGKTVKLCDFGLAAKMTTRGLRGEFGTAPMMSPEMLIGEVYDYGTDVWSFGAMAYLMLFKELPYVPSENSPKAAKAAVKSGTPPPRWLHSAWRGDKSCTPLLRQLLRRDTKQRCTAAEALDSPFFQCAVSSRKSSGSKSSALRAATPEVSSGGVWLSESTAEPTLSMNIDGSLDTLKSKATSNSRRNSKSSKASSGFFYVGDAH